MIAKFLYIIAERYVTLHKRSAIAITFYLRRARMFQTAHFFPSYAMHKGGLCRRVVFVRPSVCLSVTFVYCVETAKYTAMECESEAVPMFSIGTNFNDPELS